MEYTYVMCKDGKAFLIGLVTCSNDDGRYHIYTFSKNDVHHARFDSVREAEETFDRWVQENRYEAWYRVCL